MIDFTFVLTRKKKEKTLIKYMEVIVTIFSMKFGLNIRHDYLFAK